MKYNFNDIEAKWQKYWAEHATFKADNHSEKPKYYVLDMFPYPSGAGLHVGHPLGYIASDIYARYKRHKGFNVLHPMGYDSFGLPAEQYAIQTGQHPKKTTDININGCLDNNGNIKEEYVLDDGNIKEEALIDKNKKTNINDLDYQKNIIKGYRRQLDILGLSFDWSREVRTSDPDYYKWTQWIFIQLFNAWYNVDLDKAEDISMLISRFENEGNTGVNATCDENTPEFTAEEWKAFSTEEQQRILLKYRLTYLAETEVNWCPQLGTVLANDEVINGVSERGGYPVVRKKMTQWIMRISAYAERLLQGLDTIDWPEPLKEMQRHWIGKSTGAHVEFKVLSPALSNGKGDSNGYMTGNPETAAVLLEKAKEMRAHPTEAEAALWQSLKGKKMGVKFRQQHLIDQFIVDFVCLDRKLIIEVDGEIHNFKKEQDQKRQEILERLGYKVIRFKNEEVMSDHDTVLHKIENTLKNQPSLKKSEKNKVLPSGKDLGWEIGVFTTRPDTIFGASFMVLAPEHELVPEITTEAQRSEVDAYIEATAKRSERDRMADVKTISGVFTGAYALHPFSGEKIPVWIGDYVLAGYGTGAVMAVPCGDQRDYDFATHFDLPIPNIFEGVDISEEAFSDKENTIIANSGFLNGLNYEQATKKIIEELEAIGQGYGKINYRIRDAVFSRQRYWGEPIPIYYKNGVPYPIPEDCLPLQLPEVEKYLPTETGEPPLGRATVWQWHEETKKIVPNNTPPLEELGEAYPLELNTMPGWAGSSWYFNRYMDAQNPDEFFSQEAISYWKDVDLYIGGSEHATGHLLYARFWQQFLYDKGLVPVKEFARKLINQGMILGESAFVYRVVCTSDGFKKHTGNMTDNAIRGFFHSSIYVSKRIADLINEDKLCVEEEEIDSAIKNILKEQIKQANARLADGETKYGESPLSLYVEKIEKNEGRDIEKPRVDITMLKETTDELNIKKFINDDKYKEFKDAIFIGEDGGVIDGKDSSSSGVFIVSREPEKMSKSKYNVVNPDDICAQYGADTLRMYEMFLGPLEQAKPWSTAGITGVHSFLKKLWRLYHSGPDNSFYVSDTPPSAEALKTLHKTIKKVQEDIENFSFNTSVSTFMICVNELTAQKCNSRDILEPMAVLISPYAPHIAEELWEKLGHTASIAYAPFPKPEEKHLTESSKTYPVSFNGKTRFTLELSLELSKAEIEEAVMAHEKTQQQLQGQPPKKVIVVPGRIINIVV